VLRALRPHEDEDAAADEGGAELAVQHDPAR
jgi:hypothetical protein